MRQFRNSGWSHYDKVQAILPNAGAKGGHAFSGLNSTVPPLTDGGIEETADGSDNVAGGSGSGGGIGGGGSSSMTVDIGSTPMSTQSSKRKVSAISVNNITPAFQSSFSPPLPVPYPAERNPSNQRLRFGHPLLRPHSNLNKAQKLLPSWACKGQSIGSLTCCTSCRTRIQR